MYNIKAAATTTIIIATTKDMLNNKNKTKKNIKTKKELWEQFNKYKDEDEPDIETKMECVYDNSPLSVKGDCGGGLCENCNYILIIGQEGFPICPNPKCGTLYTNILDFSPEWKFHNNEDKVDMSRCGNPIDPLMLESCFSGKILCGPGSSYELRKVSQWTKWKSMPNKEKSLNDEIQYITIMAQKAGINQIFINHATHIYKDLLEQKMVRGVNRDAIKASSIYIACRLNGFPRTPFEIAEIFNIDKAVANNGCSMASDLMHNIERTIEPSQKMELFSITPLTFIERFSCRLNIGEKYCLLAKFIANEIENEKLINDNNPQTISAGIILFISKTFKLNINKNSITDISGVSHVSITKVSKKLESLKSMLIPNCFYE
jgi:transcription initiation factor TFIIIB Brf1 subunit/transcription initiation factor TFIIB